MKLRSPQTMGVLITVIAGSGLLFGDTAFAQGVDDVEILETQINLEQIVRDPKSYKDMTNTSIERAGNYSGISLKGDQVIRLNDTLRRAIEHNQTLKQHNDELFEELKFLRGQRQVERNRIESITEEIRSVRGQTDEIMNLNRKYSRDIVQLRTKLNAKQAEYEEQIVQLEQQLAEYAPPVPMDAEGGTQYKIDVNVVEMAEEYHRQNRKLKEDTAKVHYNMGNVLFHKGEYHKAVGEYQRALELVPSDAAAHFNLAYVSSEYIRDYPTAMKHYREYLILNPNADDADLVREKILDAQMVADSRVPSVLEKTVNNSVRPSY